MVRKKKVEELAADVIPEEEITEETKEMLEEEPEEEEEVEIFEEEPEEEEPQVKKKKKKKKGVEEPEEDLPDYLMRLDHFDMEDLVNRIADIDTGEDYVKAVIYGDNGTGKTTFAATAPNTIFIDINEKGTKSARGTGSKVLQVKSQEDIYGIYWYLQSGKHDFKTVVIDTCTQWEDMTLRYVMDKDMESDVTRDPEMATIRDYGKRAVIMKSWIINFRDLPMNVIFICQKASKSEEDLNEDDKAIYPMLSEKIRKCLCGAVDVIGYTYIKETLKASGKDPSKMVSKSVYCMKVGPSEKYQTKIRIPKGYTLKGSVISNPNFDKLVEYMAGVAPVKKEEE